MLITLFILIFGLVNTQNEVNQLDPMICSLSMVECGEEVEYQTAIASYYTVASSSSLTASGEVFRDNGYTVAHKTLKFNTRLEICHNGCVEVIVSDRGPYIEGRDFDLSKIVKDSIGCGDICKIKYKIL